MFKDKLVLVSSLCSNEMKEWEYRNEKIFAVNLVQK